MDNTFRYNDRVKVERARSGNRAKITKLPPELVFAVSRHLTPQDQQLLSQASRYFRYIFLGNRLRNVWLGSCDRLKERALQAGVWVDQDQFPVLRVPHSELEYFGKLLRFHFLKSSQSNVVVNCSGPMQYSSDLDEHEPLELQELKLLKELQEKIGVSKTRIRLINPPPSYVDKFLMERSLANNALFVDYCGESITRLRLVLDGRLLFKRLPSNIDSVDIVPVDGMNIDMALLQRFLDCSIDGSRVNSLHVEGKADNPTVDLRIPDSVTSFNNLLSHHNGSINAKYVSHLAIDQFGSHDLKDIALKITAMDHTALSDNVELPFQWQFRTEISGYDSVKRITLGLDLRESCNYGPSMVDHLSRPRFEIGPLPIRFPNLECVEILAVGYTFTAFYKLFRDTFGSLQGLKCLKCHFVLCYSTCPFQAKKTILTNLSGINRMLAASLRPFSEKLFTTFHASAKQVVIYDDGCYQQLVCEQDLNTVDPSRITAPQLTKSAHRGKVPGRSTCTVELHV